MYNYIGLAMLGLFAFMVIPINVDANEDSFNYYGVGTIVQFDADGNEIYQETVHNRIVDTGETFLIEQSFKEGTAGETVDADQIASICLTAEVGFAPGETLVVGGAGGFDTDDNIAGGNTNCISDTAVDTSTPQTAVIGPETFQSGGTHVPDGTIVTGIGICQGSGTTPFETCAAAQSAPVGILFAAVAFGTSVTLGTGESLQVTYTFDATTSGT